MTEHSSTPETSRRVSTSVSSTKARILEVAAELVANSPDGDVSTRAVCEAAGVGAPALYRHFGDKEGLLSAVVDHGYEKYLATKRGRRPGTDPIQDLEAGRGSGRGSGRSAPRHPPRRTPPSGPEAGVHLERVRPPGRVAGPLGVECSVQRFDGQRACDH